MKLIKSSFMQKVIIVLVALIIFNAAIPQEVKAIDYGGILLKPISTIILYILVEIDVYIGIMLNGLSGTVHIIGGIIEAIMSKPQALVDVSEGISDFFIGPDAIFAGNVEFLNANIFKVASPADPTQWINMFQDLGVTEGIATMTSPGYHLMITIKRGVATTYKVLRDICGYIMLAGLIWTGIRIVLSVNTPGKKSQYMQLLQDWFIGMALLIFAHVIMVGVFYISDTLVEALAVNLNGVGGINANLVWNCLVSFDSAEQTICLVMLGYLIYLTVVFAFSYIKRLMWICILIVIAPVVSIMYVFGNQTKSIYGKWLKEYMTLVFIQPFHIVVYYILVSIPLNMVNSTGGVGSTIGNSFEIIYALIAIGFIRPAEKWIRSLFGMGDGLASQASYESGKNTLRQVVTTVATIVASVYTGGAAAGIMKGAGGLLARVAAKKGAKGAIAKGGLKLASKVGSAKNDLLYKSDSKSRAIDNEGSGNTNGKGSGNVSKSNSSSKSSSSSNDKSDEGTKRELRAVPKFFSDAFKVYTGKKGIAETLAGFNPAVMPNFMREGFSAVKEEFSDAIEAFKKLEQSGDLQKIHQGFNEVRDSFYIGGAPKDWQASNKVMQERTERMVAQNKFNFVNNVENRTYMTEQFRASEEFARMQKAYEDKGDEYIAMKVAERVKSKLKELADDYASLGVTDARIAYECHELRKTEGLTAKEAVKRVTN